MQQFGFILATLAKLHFFNDKARLERIRFHNPGIYKFYIKSHN